MFGLSFGESTGLTDTCRPIGLRPPSAARKRLVDDRTRAGCPCVSRASKCAAGDDRQFERRKISRAHDLILRRRLARRVHRRVADHLVGQRIFAEHRFAERQRRCPRHVRTPGTRPHFRLDLVEKLLQLLGRRIGRSQRIHQHRQHVLRRDSRDRTTGPPSACAAASRRRTTATPPSRPRPSPAGCASARRRRWWCGCRRPSLPATRSSSPARPARCRTPRRRSAPRSRRTPPRACRTCSVTVRRQQTFGNQHRRHAAESPRRRQCRARRR